MTAQGPGLPETVAGALLNLHADPGVLNHIIFCNILHIFAFVVLAAVLFTASISLRVPRTIPWFLLVSSATLGAGSRILIVGQQIGSDPNNAICITQAILLNGTAILNIYMSAALLLQFYLTVLAVQRSREVPCTPFILMQMVPIIVFLGTVLAVLVVATEDPSLIHRTSTGMYCELEASALNVSLTAVGLVGVLATVTVKALIAYNFLLTRKIHTRTDLPATAMNWSHAARALGYTVILFVIFVLGVASFIPGDTKMLSIITDIVVSVGSATTAIIFATESDILKAWFFWQKSKDPDTTDNV